MSLWLVWGVRFGLFAVLGYAGLLKLNDPSQAEQFVFELVGVRSVDLVRAVAVGELAVALWLASGIASRAASFVVAAIFTIFAVTHVFATFSPEPISSCGCLGGSEAAQSIPPAGWIAINCGLAALAVLAMRLTPTAIPRSRTPHTPLEEAQPCAATA